MIGEQWHIFRGALIAFVGDTPAINMVGGFKEGVGMAMRKCRHCMATIDEVQTKVDHLHYLLKLIKVFSLVSGT